MRGHVAKKGKRWYPVVDVRDPATGERKRKWHGGHDTKREATRALTDILGRLDAGTYVAAAAPSLDSFSRTGCRPCARAFGPRRSRATR
jgi:Arm DNA-binding domain